MLENSPKFFRNDLFQGIDQYLCFQWFVVAVEHRPAGVRLKQCFIYRDLDHHTRLGLSMPRELCPDVEGLLTSWMQVALYMTLA